jgi:hypothetical protein
VVKDTIVIFEHDLVPDVDADFAGRKGLALLRNDDRFGRPGEPGRNKKQEDKDRKRSNRLIPELVTNALIGRVG